MASDLRSAKRDIDQYIMAADNDHLLTMRDSASYQISLLEYTLMRINDELAARRSCSVEVIL